MKTLGNHPRPNQTEFRTHRLRSVRKNKSIIPPRGFVTVASLGFFLVASVLGESTSRGQDQKKAAQDRPAAEQKEQIPLPDTTEEPIEEGLLEEDLNVPPIVYDPAAATNEMNNDFLTGTIKVTWYKTMKKYKFGAAGANPNGVFLYFPKVENSDLTPGSFQPILQEVQTHGLNATQTDIEVNAFYYRCYRVRPKPTSSLFSHHVALPKTTDPTTDDSIPEQEVMRDRYKVNNVLKDRVFDVTFPGDANPTRFVWRKVKDPFDDNSLWNLMLPFYPQQAGGGGDGDNAGPVAINPTFDPQARRASPELSRATSPQPSKQLPPGSAGPVPAPADGQP